MVDNHKVKTIIPPDKIKNRVGVGTLDESTPMLKSEAAAPEASCDGAALPPPGGEGGLQADGVQLWEAGAGQGVRCKNTQKTVETLGSLEVLAVFPVFWWKIYLG